MATATGYLELNIKGFESAISSAKKALAGLAVGFVSFKTAQWFKTGVEGAIEFGKEMYQASKRMGNFDPGQLLIAQKTLERMGLSAEEARNQMGELIHTGRPLSSLFRSSSDFAANMNRSKRDFGTQASILSKVASDFNQAFYTISAIGEKMKTNFMAFTSGFIKPLQGLLNTLNAVDHTAFARGFGESVGKAITVINGAIKSGNLINLIKTGLKAAFYNAVTFLWDGLKKVGGIVKNAMNNAWGGFFNKVEDLPKYLKYVAMEFVNFLWDQLKTNIVNAGNLLKSGFEVAAEVSFRIGQALQEGVGKVVKLIGDKLQGAVDMISDGFLKAVGVVGKIVGSIGQMVRSAIGFMASGISNVVSTLWGGMLNVSKNVGEWFTKAFSVSVMHLGDMLNELFSANWIQLIVDRFKAMFSGIGAIIAGAVGADSTEEEYRKAALQYHDSAEARLKTLSADISSLFSGDIFNTDDLKAYFNRKNDGEDMTKKATDDFANMVADMNLIASGSGEDKKTPEGLRQGLGKQDPYKVIADSLASVGGGGGFIRQGMSVAERAAAAQAKAAREMLDQQKKTNQLLERGFGGLGGDFKPGKDREFTGMTKDRAGIKPTSGLSKERQGLNMKR